MYRLKPLLLSLAAATALSMVPLSFDTMQLPVGVAPTEAATTVSIDIFFQPLAAYGVWVKNTKYRYVFCPKVDARWRPYSHGRWIFLKNYGWFFASDEPFAWAVYHYGRWFRDPRIGWCWVPGNAWAGAWVAWRRSNDFVGWAPLPPTREGFSVDVDIFNEEPPQDTWVFVQPKRFLEPQLNVAVVFGDQQPDAFQKTQFVGPVVVQNNIVVNNIIDVNFIQQQTGQQVKQVEPKVVTDPGQAGTNAGGDTVALFAPQIEPPKQNEAPPKAVDETQAAQQIGNPQASAPSEQPSSAEAASSQASSQVASSQAASSEPKAPASSSEQMAPAASSEEKPAASSSEQKAPAASSEEKAPASSSEMKPAPVSSEEKAPAPSSEEKAAPPPSKEQAPPASSEEKAAPAPSAKKPAPAECPKGYEIVNGKCVPIASSAAQ